MRFALRAVTALLGCLALLATGAGTALADYGDAAPMAADVLGGGGPVVSATTVGTAGGRVAATDGATTIVVDVPAGAVDHQVVVAVRAVQRSEVSGDLVTGYAVVIADADGREVSLAVPASMSIRSPGLSTSSKLVLRGYGLVVDEALDGGAVVASLTGSGSVVVLAAAHSGAPVRNQPSSGASIGGDAGSLPRTGGNGTQAMLLGLAATALVGAGLGLVAAARTVSGRSSGRPRR